jgi:hypothetical protein
VRALEEVRAHWSAEGVGVEPAQLWKDGAWVVSPCIAEQCVQHALRRRGAALAWGGDLGEREDGQLVAVGGRRRVADDIGAARR